MSLREEFKSKVSLVEHAGWQTITSRLDQLLSWMRSQPETDSILKELKSNGPVFEKLNLGPHPQVRAVVAEAAGTEKDVAAVGLAMMELCSVPHGRDRFHQIASSFGFNAPRNAPSPTDYLCGAAMNQFVTPLLNYVSRQLPKDGQTIMKTENQELVASRVEPANSKNPQTVFVIHGRNEKARNAMFEFLRTIGLRPLEWSQAVAATGEASPYIGQVLDTAFTIAQAVVVLMTPDDEACLKKEFQSAHDEPYEKQPTGQARPNVLFEAGMAMGRHPRRTVLVQLGELRPFSDVGGRHVIRLNDSSERRHDLAERLKTAGCAVDLSGRDWHKAGSFNLPPTRNTISSATSEVPHDSVDPVPLDEIQVKILKTLSDVDGESVQAEQLATALGLAVSRLKYIADRLEKSGYLHSPIIIGGGRRYTLVDKGRAYLVENNLL